MEILNNNLTHLMKMCAERDAVIEGSHSNIMWMLLVDKDGVQKQTVVLVQSDDPEAYGVYISSLLRGINGK